MKGKRNAPSRRIAVKTASEQECMRRAGRIVALTLQKVGLAIRPGISTGELDALAEHTIRSLGAIPAFLGYIVGNNKYPATACISINEQVVHGIPGMRPLRAGDLVKVDLGAIVDGWYADSAYTYPVGDVSELAQRLMKCGQGALAVGVEAARAGKRVRDIGAAVQRYTESHGFSVVRALCGHGIGQNLHEEPQVPNYPTSRGDMELREGMALAIEPMVNAGGPDVFMEPDGWTFVTADAMLSVHYEHTVLIQPDGPEIITNLR